jgi:PKD repeat protein
MIASIRHGALGLLLAVAVSAAAVGPARAAGVANARITGTFVMHGRIVTAVRVHGEHPGQAVTRRWTFSEAACARGSCRQLHLRRQRSANHYDRLTLTRVGVGSYAGRTEFTSALRCRGRLYRHGLLVPYRITVQVSQVVPIEGIRFAGQVTAGYTNLRRIDHTACPIGPSHDAAQYIGVATPIPSPPAAAFTVTANPAADGATVTDTSTRGAGGARILSRVWRFGDPVSGGANTARGARASHTFSAPGVYAVTLTVTDANGLRAIATQTVTAPGPPTAAFTATEVGATRTYALRDASDPGIGGSAIVAWGWSFGDARSGADTSGAENPQHSFSAPGTYEVCLVVTDANNREAGHCSPVVVPPGATSAAAHSLKRTVASTALSSPRSWAGRRRAGDTTA